MNRQPACARRELPERSKVMSDMWVDPLTIHERQARTHTAPERSLPPATARLDDRHRGSSGSAEDREGPVLWLPGHRL